MASNRFQRRQFLKGALGGGASLLLSSCASFDAAFTNNKRILEKEILIVGGGAAGLAAAYELKKAKIPFRLFEGSQRLGGRAYAAHLSGGQKVDLGAEFFSSTDTTLLGYLKEFGYRPQEWAPQNESFVIRNQEYIPAQNKKDIQKFLRALIEAKQDLFASQSLILTYENAPRLERSAYYDSLSLAEFLSEIAKKTSFELAKAFEMQFEFKYGTSADNIAALHFLNELSLDGAKNLILPETLGAFMDSLAERVIGPIPGYFARTQMELIEIQEIPLGLELIFKTPQGRESYFAKQVILALPSQQLLKVKGLSSLNFERDILRSLQSLNHGKMVKAAVREINKNSLLRFAPAVTHWSYGESLRELTTYQSPDREIMARMINKDKEWLAYRDWTQVKMIGAGSSYFTPKTYAQNMGIFQGPLVEGKVLLVGDFTEVQKFQTLEGALLSGVKAARSITQ
ncbi:MAG: FAD-dependent oxidoreductase [Bdellovibrionia bacterium]